MIVEISSEEIPRYSLAKVAINSYRALSVVDITSERSVSHIRYETNSPVYFGDNETVLVIFEFVGLLELKMQLF